MCAGCPIPTWEVSENLAPFVADEGLVNPAEGWLDNQLACPAEAASPLQEFSVAGAVEDPDGDRLYYHWYVDWSEEQYVDPLNDATGLDPDDRYTETDWALLCSDLETPAGIHEVQVLITDRPLLAARAQIQVEGTSNVRIVWLLEVKE